MSVHPKKHPVWYETLRSTAGLRLTRQRSEVYRVLLETRDHPTAALVYERVRKRMPSISLATIYNCLEALVEKKLVNQVNFDRKPARYCPNLTEHVHLMDETTGAVTDITFKNGFCIESVLDLPQDLEISQVEICIRARRNPRSGRG